MRYWALKDRDVAVIAEELSSNESSRNDDRVLALVGHHRRSVRSHGTGGDREVDYAPIADAAVSIRRRLAEVGEVKDRDAVEGWACGLVSAALGDVPVDVLDDEEFWSYLAVRYFWEFILWREASALTEGNVHKYFNGAGGADSIPLRLHLRAQAVRVEDRGHELASAVAQGTDFWRSHVLRVRLGRARPLARALATIQRDERMSTKVLRQVARRINRLWSNIVLYEYDETEGHRVISEIRRAVEAERGDTASK